MGLIKARSRSLVAVLALIPLGLLPTTSSATDLITQLDSAVISMHDYSVINGQITTKATDATVQAAVSKMNRQLFTIKTNLTTFDAAVTQSWKFLSPKANGTYPARETMRQFDLTAFAWYSYELNAQKKIVECFKNTATSKQCVLKLKAKNKKVELAKYSKVTAQLNIIEKWRVIAKR